MGMFKRNSNSLEMFGITGYYSSKKSLSFLIITSVLMNSFVMSADNLTPRGVPLSRAALYDPQKNFSCLDGSKLIPFSFVNDDYCDCADGSDEPGTSACNRGSFFCLNAGHVSGYILSTRVNDGICDCCDGSDEEAFGQVTCPNTCEEMGRAAREEAERQAKLAKEGYQKRLQMVATGKSFRKEKEVERTRLDADRQIAESVKNEKQVLKDQLEQPEKEALDRYRQIQDEKRRLEEEAENAKSENEAEALFNLLDSNGDDKITLDEIKVRQTFDKNKDGEVDDEEARFFLNMDEEMSKDEFMKSGWLLVKPFFMMEQGMFTPPGGQASNENYEDDIGKATQEHEPSDSDKPEIPGVEDVPNEDDEEEDTLGEESETDPEPAEPVIDTDPKYDDETQSLIDQANKAREEFNEADRNLRESVRKLEELNELLNVDFGDDDRFSPLHGECFDYEDKEYVYSLCPFKSASQKIRSGGDVSLGKWNSWSGPETDKHSSMLYDRGQSCWNGPQRSARVTLRCGLDNRLISVAEPSRCEYHFEFESPASCQKPDGSHSHDEL